MAPSTPIVAACARLSALLGGEAGSLCHQASSERIWAGFDGSAEDNTGLPSEPSEAGPVGRGGAAK